MLHPAQTNWTPSGDAHAAAFDRPQAVTVSSLQAATLYEQPGSEHQVALTTQVPHRSQASVQAQGAYRMDTAVFALGLLGLWMMVVGSAMLARRLAQLKAQPITSS